MNVKYYYILVCKYMLQHNLRLHMRNQFSSVIHSCLTLCDPMNCSMPGLPVHHQLSEFTQTHIYRVGDAIQPSHPLSPPSPPAPNPSQTWGVETPNKTSQTHSHKCSYLQRASWKCPYKTCLNTDKWDGHYKNYLNPLKCAK